MPVDSRIEVVGVKETIKALRRLDPEQRKEFNRGVKDVLAPMVSSAKSAYPSMPLQGMSRNWTQGANQKFPYDVRKVRTGVKVKISTRRSTDNVVYVSQGNAAGAIFEVAGSKNPGTQFNASLRGRNSRVLWPVFDRFNSSIVEGIDHLVRKAEKTVQELTR
jgi:hypothetical protein